jgi:hypothetical protein
MADTISPSGYASRPRKSGKINREYLIWLERMRQTGVQRCQLLLGFGIHCHPLSFHEGKRLLKGVITGNPGTFGWRCMNSAQLSEHRRNKSRRVRIRRVNGKRQFGGLIGSGVHHLKHMDYPLALRAHFQSIYKSICVNTRIFIDSSCSGNRNRKITIKCAVFGNGI